ncbi:MAG: hypothetical protein J6N74_09015 [Chryseobacterium sp.]|nr:hypothetical protein [Chryseobacterium sp.]
MMKIIKSTMEWNTNQTDKENSRASIIPEKESGSKIRRADVGEIGKSIIIKDENILFFIC